MLNTLYDITKYYKHNNLIGEERIALVMTLISTLGKAKGFGIEAASGSGKTVVMDICYGVPDKSDGLIKSEYVYFKDAGSGTSMFWDADEINKKRIIVLRELQKDKSENAIEAVKSLTEGKAAIRKVTNIIKQGVDNQVIDAKTVIYSLAIENETKPDAELKRRFITMSTDISQKQTENVVIGKAALRWDKKSNNQMTPEEIKVLKTHIDNLIKFKVEIANPFTETYAKTIIQFAPDQKIRSMAEHFWDLVEAITKFHLGARVMVGNTMFTNVQDILMALDIYKYSFIRDVYGIPPIGDHVLRAFKYAIVKKPVSSTLTKHIDGGESTGVWMSLNDIRRVIKDKFNIILSSKVVFTICRQLVDAGYLEDLRDGNTTRFQVIDEVKELIDPDVKTLIKEAAGRVKARYPDKYQEWIKLQADKYQHPVTGAWLQTVK